MMCQLFVFFVALVPILAFGQQAPSAFGQPKDLSSANIAWQISQWRLHRSRRVGRTLEFYVSSTPTTVDQIPIPGFNVSCANRFSDGLKSCRTPEDETAENGTTSANGAIYLSGWEDWMHSGAITNSTAFRISQIFYSPEKNASYNITADFLADFSQFDATLNFTVSPKSMIETPTCRRAKAPCPPPPVQDVPLIVTNTTQHLEIPDPFIYSWMVADWAASPAEIDFLIQGKDMFNGYPDSNVPSFKAHCSSKTAFDRQPNVNDPLSYTTCITTPAEVTVGFWYVRPKVSDTCSAGKLGILFSWPWEYEWVYTWGSQKLRGGWNMTGAVDHGYGFSNPNDTAGMFSVFPTESRLVSSNKDES